MLHNPERSVELTTPERERVAAIINLYREPPLMRVKFGMWDTLLEKLKSFGAGLSTYKKIAADWYRQWSSDVPTSEIAMSRKRKGKCGKPTKINKEKVEAIVRINAKYKGKLSLRKLGAKLQEEEGIHIPHSTLHELPNIMGMRRLRRYLKPKLSRLHRIKRLEHVLDELVKGDDGSPKLFPFDEILGE